MLSSTQGKVTRDEEGFTLLEVVIALLVMGLLAASTVQLLVNTLDLTGSNAKRVAAANLMTRQFEFARSLRTLDIPNGTTMTTQTVGGITYTIRQTAAFVVAGSTTTACTGSIGALTNKLVTVSVTWPNMGSVKPVKAETLKSLGLGADGLASGSGVAAILVQGASGQPQSGAPVTLTPGGASQITAEDGCAVFVGLSPATYTATAALSGWVGIKGESHPLAKDIGVRAGELTRASIDFDLAGALEVALTPPAGHTTPDAMGVTLYNSIWAPKSSQAFADCSEVSTAPTDCVSGAPGAARVAGALFPGTYTAWAGTCPDAQPSPLPNFAVVAPGTAAGMSADLAGAVVNVQTSTGTPLTGQTVYAIRVVDPSIDCPAGETLVLAAGMSSTVKPALPPGMWTFALTQDGGAAPSGGWPWATLTLGAVPPTVSVTSP